MLIGAESGSELKIMKKKFEIRKIIYSVIELLFFGLSFVFLIPVEVSDTGDPPEALVPKIAAIMFFALTKVVSLMRKSSSVPHAACELIIFSVFAYVLGLID